MTLLLNQAYSQFAIPKELQLFDNNPNQLVAQNQYYSVIKPKSASIRNKNCLRQPYLLMDRGEMSNLYRGPPMDASYQISVHLAKRFQRRRFFRNQPIRNNNCLWQPCLLTDRDEMSNRNRGLFIDASYQVLVHLAKWFQRRRI